MTDKPVHILSTRHLDEGVVEKAACHHIHIYTAEFIAIQPITNLQVQSTVNLLAAEPATVVFTSQNAVDTLVPLLPVATKMPDWNIYCLGGATFTLVKKFWPYGNIVHTAHNATSLAQQIAADGVKKVTFFCGNNRRDELPALLAQSGVVVNELVIYQSAETPLKIDRKYDAVLFFSPSAVSSFFRLNDPPSATIMFAIGHTTAHAIKQFCSNQMIIGDFPAKDQLVDKAIQFFSSQSSAGNQPRT